MYHDQAEYDIKFEWGEQGLKTLLPNSDVIIVVDVLSFTTCVSVAVSRGALVYPFQWKGAQLEAYAIKTGAIAAGRRGEAKISLSPSTLQILEQGQKVILPSPNGSTLSLMTGKVPTFAGCLRNAKAVASAAAKLGSQISVIACGERWNKDQSLRPALEDIVGAGSIIADLPGTLSSEAQFAKDTFESAKTELADRIGACSSGKELIERGYPEDIALACQLNADNTAPFLSEAFYYYKVARV